MLAALFRQPDLWRSTPSLENFYLVQCWAWLGSTPSFLTTKTPVWRSEPDFLVSDDTVPNHGNLRSLSWSSRDLRLCLVFSVRAFFFSYAQSLSLTQTNQRRNEEVFGRLLGFGAHEWWVL
jgi:hypothetical protein